jgi:hypothetical protein
MNTNDSQPGSTPRRRVNSNHNVLQNVQNISTQKGKSETLGRLNGLKERTIKILDRYLKEMSGIKHKQ